MDTLKLVNGNGNAYKLDMPRLIIQAETIQEPALKRIEENAGLRFKKSGLGYEAQPVSHWQLAALFLTYNFKTRYFNNATLGNTLMLRFDHHVGFDVRHICYDCCKANHIHTGSLEPGDRLAC